MRRGLEVLPFWIRKAVRAERSNFNTKNTKDAKGTKAPR